MSGGASAALRAPEPEPAAERSLAIEVNDLTVAYREQPVLWDVDLGVPAGVLMAIVGPNGAGKTTLIKAILGLVPPAAGRSLVHGAPYAQQRQLVGYVPQRGSVDWDFPTTRARRGDDGPLRRARLAAASGPRGARGGAGGAGEGRRWRTSPTGRSASSPAASSSASSSPARSCRTRAST